LGNKENPALVSSLRIPEQLTVHENIAAVLYSISQEATRLLNAERATIYIYDHEKDVLFSYVASKLEIDEIVLKTGEGIAGKVARTRESMIVHDVEKCPDFNAFYDSQTNFKTKNLITMPLVNQKDELIGVIQVLNKKDGEFGEGDLQVLKILASVSAIAIEQAQLSQENNILKEYNRLLLQNFNAGILALDSQWRIQDFNDKFLKMFSLEENVKGKKLEKVHGELYRQIKAVTKEEKHIEMKWGEHYLNITASDLLNFKKKMVGKLCLITDITHKVKLRQAKEIEERMSILGKMSSQIIHDIKNPLFVLRGYIKLLTSTDDEDDIKRYSQIMEQEIERILEISQEILEFSRGDIDIIVSTMDALNFNNIIIDLIKKIDDIYDIRVNCILDNDHPEKNLKIDVYKIERALRNILVNSIEAFSDDQNPVIEIETKFYDKEVQVMIRDKGKGVPEEIWKSVFEPFVTHEKHGGTLDLIRESGWKTAFLMTIPLES
jgi:signal transduction histidine kinase